jgi:hypothetical protein
VRRLAPTTGRLQISGSSGAPIVLDGTRRGVTPAELQVFDGSALIGNSATNRILVLAGRHSITLVNAELQYEAVQTVDVAAGRVATIRVEVPNGVLHVNAGPWAEVFVDGRRVGETPIANLAVRVKPQQ